MLVIPLPCNWRLNHASWLNIAQAGVQTVGWYGLMASPSLHRTIHTIDTLNTSSQVPLHLWARLRRLTEGCVWRNAAPLTMNRGTKSAETRVQRPPARLWVHHCTDLGRGSNNRADEIRRRMLGEFIFLLFLGRLFFTPALSPSLSDGWLNPNAKGQAFNPGLLRMRKRAPVLIALSCFPRVF